MTALAREPAPRDGTGEGDEPRNSTGEGDEPRNSTGEGDEARRASDRVARLLEELQQMSTPPAWQRVEQLVHTLLDLYGGALERVVQQVAGAADLGALRDGLLADELVASLLLLHGLHPDPPETRIRRALEAASDRIGPVALLGIADGVARLHLPAGSAPHLAPASVARVIETLVRDAAPEIAQVSLEGEGLPPADEAPRALGQPLVQIDLDRSRARSAP